MITTVLLSAALITAAPSQPASYSGFNNAAWGSSPDAVRQAAGASSWQADQTTAAEFPKDLCVTVYRSSAEIAGYPANVVYYFWNNKFFQATVTFPFNDLVTYDFNYNVYRSVKEYYNAIHSRTLVFVRDIYSLLRKKYGKKEPYFEDLDPRNVFVNLDAYLNRETWNLRYHPYDFYQRIKTQAYARWDFPKTRALFSIAISAPDKRFDYKLSLASIELAATVNAAKDSLQMKGL